MGHVSANHSSANDKFFLAGHGDLPSVQPNSHGHCVSSFMSCNPRFNCHHCAMPIVTISTALRASSSENKASCRKTLTRREFRLDIGNV